MSVVGYGRGTRQASLLICALICFLLYAGLPQRVPQTGGAIEVEVPVVKDDATQVTDSPTAGDENVSLFALARSADLIAETAKAVHDKPRAAIDLYSPLLKDEALYQKTLANARAHVPSEGRTIIPATVIKLSEEEIVALKAEALTMPATEEDIEIIEDDHRYNFTKTVVMGRLSSEDTSWVATHNPDWDSAIYVVDLPPGASSPTGFRTKMNKAREAMPYLTYIIDHYPDFPDVMAFIHPHRNQMPASWHTDARRHDAKSMLEDLRLDTVIQHGYVNLRCHATDPGCPAEIMPWREPRIAENHVEHAYPKLFAAVFNISMDATRYALDIVATACCAQFAVSRDQLLSRPKSDYERMLRALEETELEDDISGRVMEYMWHIIFDRDHVHCPEYFDCYCDVYGYCGLQAPERYRPDLRAKAREMLRKKNADDKRKRPNGGSAFDFLE